MLMNVTAIKPLKASLAVTADGKEYLAKKNSGISAGMTIDAFTEASEFNGKTYVWIKTWKAVNGSAAPQAETNRTTGQDRPATSAVAAPIWSNFVSNQVAHAIQAGLITDPTHIKLWAAAAKQAFMELA